MKNLRKLREQKGLSQQKLAEKFSISQQAVYKYENGLSEPDIQTLMQLADYFNTSVDYLIDYTASPDIEHVILNIQLSTKDMKFLKKYLTLTQHQKAVIQDMVDCLTDKE